MNTTRHNIRPKRKSNPKKALLILILFAMMMGGVTQLVRYQAAMADATSAGISFSSRIPSNTDSSREGRSFQANISYTGATGLQARFSITNQGSINYTNVFFLIKAPSLVKLADSIVFADPDYQDIAWTYTELNLGDTLEFTLPSLNIGQTIDLTFYYDTSNVQVSSPQQVDFEYLVTGDRIGYGEPVSILSAKHTIEILPPPTDRIIAIFFITAAIFLAILYLSWSGAFGFFSTEDLIMIAIIGAIQTVYVQIIGRQFVFPVVDRVPGGFFFAIGDLPYIFLLVAAVAITKKPGTVSLVLFVYNITSEIGWYGLNPLWWMYPFAQGLVADIYILIRGKGIFTNQMTWLNWSTSPEPTSSSGGGGGTNGEGGTRTPQKEIDFDAFIDDDVELEELKSKDTLARKNTGIPGLLDGAVIGFLRGFFMQLSLYLVFYPNLFHVYYDVGYFSIIVITWAIGNAVAGAISVPIARVVEEALSF